MLGVASCRQVEHSCAFIEYHAGKVKFGIVHCVFAGDWPEIGLHVWHVVLLTAGKRQK